MYYNEIKKRRVKTMKKILILFLIVIGILNAQDIQEVKVEIISPNKIVKIIKIDRDGLSQLILTGNNGNIIIEIKDRRIKKGDTAELMLRKGKLLVYDVSQYINNGIITITGSKAEELYYNLYNIEFLFLDVNNIEHSTFVLTKLTPELRKYKKPFGADDF